MKIKWTFGILLGLGLLTTSCKKEGCTDVDATNFNVDAKKDDGTCSYEGRQVVWYGESAANSLVLDGATSLTYYVDGQLVGSSAANIYWNVAPDCGQDASVTITKNLGSVKTQAYTYKVLDQTGWEYWSGVLNFNANTCTSSELTW
jgi:hypothetical protein